MPRRRRSRLRSLLTMLAALGGAAALRKRRLEANQRRYKLP